jgi:hypothetical protein
LKADDHRNGEDRRNGVSNPGRDYIELWIGLSRLSWGSLVVVPADRDGSTATIATALADIGQRLSYGPVTAITVNAFEYGSALALSDLQQHIDRERRGGVATVVGPAEPPPQEHDVVVDGPDAAPAPAPAEVRPAEGGRPRSQAIMVVPPARLVISVPPVVSEPLGLAAVSQADLVVLAVQRYRSRIADVRRTVELVGRKRIAGCLLIR